MKKPIPLIRFKFVRQGDRRQLSRVENLIGIRIAHAAYQARIGERAFQSSVFKDQCSAKAVEIRRENLDPTGIKIASIPLRPELHRAKRGALSQLPSTPATPWENQRLRVHFFRRAWSAEASNASGPQSSNEAPATGLPSTPTAMRFPIRRIPSTGRPSTLAIGGSTVRRRNTLARRTCSSVWPRIRSSSAAI